MKEYIIRAKTVVSVTANSKKQAIEYFNDEVNGNHYDIEVDDPRWEYIQGTFPSNKAQARDCWEQICDALAPENLAEDGELPVYLQKRKKTSIMRDSKLLYKYYRCPKDVAEMCDDGATLMKFIGTQE